MCIACAEISIRSLITSSGLITSAQHQSEFPELTWQFVVFGHNEHEIPVAREMANKLGMAFCTKITWDAKFSSIRDKVFVRVQSGEAATRQEYELIHGKKYLSSDLSTAV